MTRRYEIRTNLETLQDNLLYTYYFVLVFSSYSMEGPLMNSTMKDGKTGLILFNRL